MYFSVNYSRFDYGNAVVMFKIPTNASMSGLCLPVLTEWKVTICVNVFNGQIVS